MLGKRILVVAAHPDDDILGCAGSMYKLQKNGAEIRVLFIGEGSSGRFSIADHNSMQCKNAILNREKSAKIALGFINVKNITFLNNPAGRFDTIPLIDIGKSIELEIAEFCPDTIFTHSNVDANSDHRITFQATLQATRPGALNHVASLLSYEVPSSTEWRFIKTFRPTYFVEITNEIDSKIKAMNTYTSEVKPFPFPRSPENIRALAMVRGSQAGVAYAEAFEIVRGILK